MPPSAERPTADEGDYLRQPALTGFFQVRKFIRQGRNPLGLNPTRDLMSPANVAILSADR